MLICKLLVKRNEDVKNPEELRGGIKGTLIQAAE